MGEAALCQRAEDFPDRHSILASIALPQRRPGTAGGVKPGRAAGIVVGRDQVTTNARRPASSTGSHGEHGKSKSI